MREYQSIPAELRTLQQWVCWGVFDDRLKMPVNPATGKPARAGDPSTWSSFEAAAKYKAAGHCKGIGFEFNNNGIVGVDFDHCLKDGKLMPFAAKWVKALDSYTEISPSGEGIHVLVKGRLPGKPVKRPECEMYEQGRYFTVTGKPFGPARPLREAQDVINALHQKLTPAASVSTVDTLQPRSIVPAGKDYLQIGLERDPTFAALWNGNRPHGNESSDDQALMNKLAYWCNCNADQMKAAFETSPHTQSKDAKHKKKAMRPDYMARTVSAAIQSCKDTAANHDAEFQSRRIQQSVTAGDVFGRSEHQPENQPNEPPPFMGDVAADVGIEQVDWLVDGVFPLSELSIIGADGGTGKGLLISQLIACVTAGAANPFFPTFHGEPAPVLVFSGEDDLSKVIKPRILAAGADPTLVRVVEASKYQMATGKRLLLGSPAFLNIVREAKPRLVIVDPLQSFLPGTVEMAARNEMREVMIPYLGVCRELIAAGITVMHSNKRGNVAGRLRLADSSDMWDMARSVIMLGREKGTGLIYASHEKSSYAKPANTTMFKIEDTVVEGCVHTGLAVFQSYSDRHDADFIAEKMQRASVTKDEAKDALINALSESSLGSIESGKLKQQVAAELECSSKTVERAYTDLVKEGRIHKAAIRQKDGVNKWYASLTCLESKEEVPEKA